MAKEMGRRGCPCFPEVDERIRVRKRRQVKYGVGVDALLAYFQSEYEKHSMFSYEIQVDDQIHLTSCFWSDRLSKYNYQAFHDVLYFDVMDKTDECDLPFGLFMGVNHHKQFVLFGAGILFSETVDDFKWLFVTFLDAMLGIAPKTVVTNLDPAISRAVASVFPQSHHVVCMWHIQKKIPEMLGAVYRRFPGFEVIWQTCIENSKEINDFEKNWSGMLEDYGLKDNTWLQQLYRIRQMWVPAYTRSIFLAGITFTSKCESITAIFDSFEGHKKTLVELAKAYEWVCIERWGDESRADQKATYGTHRTPTLKTLHNIEFEMANLYTREIFSEFQDELDKSQNYIPALEQSEENCYKYTVSRHGSGNGIQKRTVIWDNEKCFATCSCRHYDFCGIICGHIIAVFHLRGVINMPKMHVLKRWTQKPKENLRMVVGSSTTNLVNSALARRHTLLQKWSFIINEATGGLDVYHIVVNRLEKLAAELQAYKENCLKDLNVSITAEKGLPGTEYGLGSEHFTSQQSNGIRGVENYEEPEGVTGGNLALQATRANVIHDAYAMKTNDRANKRFKSSVEMVVRGQGGRLCRGCNKVVIGHDKRNCPMKKEIYFNMEMGNGQTD